MCTSPKMPKPLPPPPPPQAPRAPTPKQAGRRNPLAPLPSGGLVGSGLLTGSQGVTSGMTLGSTSLLGGGSK